MAADQSSGRSAGVVIKAEYALCPARYNGSFQTSAARHMANAQVPVLALAINSPKWVRAYVNEVNLGKIKPGQEAYVTIDAYPNDKIPGHVGFISSVAEFTPKTVQTPDLRTNLVYEVRILVDDKDNRLRLGMPATVGFK